LCPGGELFDTLDEDQSHFSENTCRMVTVQLASALAHLHLHHQVAHCDLKPANILCKHKDVTELGCVKLADFGFCQRFKSHKEAQFTFNCGAAS